MIGKRIIVFATVISYLSCFEIHLNEPEDVTNNGEKEVIYRLEVDQIRAKLTNRIGRTLRRSRFELIISELESSFSWTDLLRGENRLAVGFNLLQGKKFVDNVVLYSPRDATYRVHGLKDSTQYFGTIRIIRDKNEIQQSNSSADSRQFRFDSPRIIQEKDKSKINDFLSKVAINKIRLDSSSVTFKLPNRIRDHYILEVYNTNESMVISKTEIHIVPNSKTIILNDLPPNALMRMVLRRINSSSSSDNVTSYLFTGSLTAGDQDQNTASTITRLVMYNKERLEKTQQQTTIRNEEKIVPCHVVNRRPFDGYPCPQSQVCLPLHWRCDGQQDCPGGLDEVNCDNYSLRAEILAAQEAKLCKVEEASCSVNNVTMCLPNKWLCDGRQDCPDGWDEKQENCPPKITTYTIPSFTQGIRRITNLLLRCRGSFFRCRSGECISDKSVCDGVNHCDDASDELYCDNDDDDDDEDDYEPDYAQEYEFRCHPRYEFKCYRSYSYSSRRCIPKAWLCDAFQDCPYGEDENTNFCSHQHLFRGYFE